MVRTILLIGAIVVMALIILAWLAVSIMAAYFENKD